MPFIRISAAPGVGAARYFMKSISKPESESRWANDAFVYGLTWV